MPETERWTREQKIGMVGHVIIPLTLALLGMILAHQQDHLVALELSAKRIERYLEDLKSDNKNQKLLALELLREEPALVEPRPMPRLEVIALALNDTDSDVAQATQELFETIRKKGTLPPNIEKQLSHDREVAKLRIFVPTEWETAMAAAVQQFLSDVHADLPPIQVLGIQQIVGPTYPEQTQLRYFTKDDKDLAGRVAEELTRTFFPKGKVETKFLDGYRMRKQSLELWFTKVGNPSGYRAAVN